jgi:hypothetical protein
MNNTALDISVSGLGSIYDVTLELVLSSQALLLLSAAYLFLWIVGPSHLKMSAIEQRAYIKLCFFFRDLMNASGGV